MLPKFLACGLAALALVRATPFQVNFAGPLETAVTAGVEAGNYSLVNVGKNETLFGAGKGQPVYMKSALGTPEPLSQWKVEPGGGLNEYKFFNIGLDSSTSTNNGRLYVSYGTGDRSLTHVVTPVQGKADMFIITLPRYGIWSVIWDSYYKQNQVAFTQDTGSPEQLWKFIRID